MKRIRVMLLFLLLGAVVNVGVAWGLAYSIPVKVLDIAQGYTNTSTHGDWVVAYFKFPGHSKVYSIWPARALPEPTPKRSAEDVLPHWANFARPEQPLADSAVMYWEVEAFGWPMHTLRVARESKFSISIDKWAQEFQKVHWGYVYEYPNYSSPRTEPLHFPLGPVWTGFAFNSLFYGIFLWLLIPGSFALRRILRRRRGLCVKCAYDLKGAEHEVCPECGGTINAR